MSQGSSTQTSSNAPPPQFTAAYSNAVQQAQNVASVPYQAYPGQTVAGLSPDQMGAINETENAQGIANPYINAGAQYINQATTPLWGETQQFSPANVQQYESPYTSQVVNATQQQFNNQNAIQQQGVIGNAISNGAFGGDRTAVAQGIVAGQQQANQAPVIAGLENQGYAQALGEFNTQQQAQLGANEANSWLNSQAGYGMANLGQEALNSQLTGASALAGVGGLEQSQAQANLNAPYQQFLAAQAYPFQTTGWEANIAEGLGGASGGSSSSTAPSNTAGQIAGAGLTGLGTLGVTGAFGQNGYLTGANGLLGSGASSASMDAANTAMTSAYSAPELAGFASDVSGIARGGVVQSRAPGGGISGFPAPSLTSVAPDVSVGIVPGADGMGDAPATHGTPAILKNYGTTSTTSGGPNTTLGMIGGLAGGIAGSFFGGPAGGFVGSQAGNAIGSALNDGGIVANDNDHWHEPERHRAVGGITPPMLPTNNPQVSTFTGNYGIPIPQLTGSGGGGGPQLATVNGGIVPTTGSGALDSYLGGQSQGAYHAPPISYTPPPPPPAAPTDGLTPEGIAYANTAAANAILNAAGSSNGGAEWRGGRVRRDDGGDIPGETAGIVNDMLDAPAGNRVTPQEATAWWQLHGASPAGSAGIVQNMTRESGLRSDIPGDYDKSGNPTSLGLFQHHNDRETALKQFADAQGASATDPYVQMQFAKHELTHDMPGLDRTMATATDPAAAESAFRTGFERPAGTNTQAGGASSGIVGPAGNVGAAGPPGAAGIAPPPADAPADDASGIAAPQHVGMGPWGAVLAAGLGTLAHNGNIGRGGMEGLQVAENEAKMDAQERDRQATMQSTTAQRQETNRHNVVDEAHAAQQLSVQAEDAKARLASTNQQHQDSLDLKQRQLDQGHFTFTPVTQPDPDDPTKTISGVQRSDTRSGDTSFIRTDTNPNKTPPSTIPSNPDDRHKLAVAIAGYQQAPLTSFAVSKPEGQAIMSEVMAVNPNYQSSRYPEVSRAMTAFGSGKQGDTVRSLNVATQHLATLDEAGQALQNGDVRLLNAIGNRINQEFGVPAPTTFDGLKQIVGTEIEKAVAGGIGSEADRSRLMQALNGANSPAQLTAISQSFKNLMAGQASGLKRQYEDATGFKTGSPFAFETKLAPETLKAIGMLPGHQPEGQQQPGGQQPAAQAAAAPPAWKYSATGPGGAMVHSNDGKAWFTPDGKPYAP